MTRQIPLALVQAWTMRMRRPLRTLTTRADVKRSLSMPRLTDELEALASRFHAPVRREVRRLMRSSPRVADLASVFPGAVHALAARRGPPAARLRALSLIEQGEPMKSVARTLDLPLWLRRLPPEAFRGTLGTVPGSEAFSRRIANRIPVNAAETAFWLATLVFAIRAADEDFAIWLAEQPIYAEAGNPEVLFPVLAAYAWFSRAASTAAHRLIVVPWRPEIAIDTALCAAKSWLNRIRLVIQLRDDTISETWLAPGSAQGFDIIALTTSAEILKEAQAMHNCVDQYIDRLTRDRCRLFSIRRDGTRMATMEIGPHPRETGVLSIMQLKARHNMPASLDVWQAAHAWLAQQPGLKRLPAMMVPPAPMNGATWNDLMQPYRDAAAGAPWLPSRDLEQSLAALDVQLADLARRGGVSSWLFT